MSNNSHKSVQESVTEEKNVFQPLSPVFKVNQYRAGRKRKKASLAQTSATNLCREDLDTSSSKLKSLGVNEEVNKSSERVTFEDDGELLNSSFSQLDKLCNNLLDGKQKSDNSKFSKSFADVFLRKKNNKTHFDYFQLLKSQKVKKQFYAKTIGTKIEPAEYNISDLFLDCFNLLEIEKEHDKDKSKSHLHENKLEKNCLNKDKKAVNNLEVEPINALQKNNFFSEFPSCTNNLQVQSNLALDSSGAITDKKDVNDSKILGFEEFKNIKNNRFNANECFIATSKTLSTSTKLHDNVEKSINFNNNHGRSRQQIFSDDALPISDFFNEEPSGFFGFSTASGTKLSLTEKSLEKAQKLMSKWDDFQDFQNDDEKWLNEAKLLPISDVTNVEQKKEIGFSTASGLKLSVTAESLEKAQKLMTKLNDNEDFCNDNLKKFNRTNSFIHNLETTEAVGFSTASGVKLSVTKESLKKTQKLMTKWNEHEDFQSKFEKSLSETTLLPISDCSNMEPTQVECSGFGGFSTASGLKLSVTKESLEKAQKILAQDKDKGFERLDVSEVKCSSNSADTQLLRSKIGRNSTPQLHRSKIARDSTPQLLRSKIARDSTPQLHRCKMARASTPLTKVDSEINSRTNFSNSFKQSDFLTAFSPIQEGKTQNSFLNLTTENQDKNELSNLLEKENSFRSNEVSMLHSPNEKSEHTFTGKSIKKGLKRGSQEFETPTKKIKCLGKTKNCNVAEEVFNIQEKRAVARFNQEIIIEEKGNVNSKKGSLLRKKTFSQQAKKKTSIHKLFSVLDLAEDMFINLSDAANYKFSGTQFFGSACTENVEGFALDDSFNIIPDDENNFGVEEFKRGFLAGPGVQPNLIPKGWIENHYKWIIWKLFYYKKAFQNCLLNILTPNNVMLQLKYRYDREIDGSERSALKKILERDDTSAKRMVLRICAINKVINQSGFEYDLNLTDGWYSCPAKIDSAMVRLIEKGKIKVGMKIITQGASLHNCEHGMSPLEVANNVYLKIFTNSTRPAKLNAKLGFQQNPGHLTVSLSSLLPDGGQISRIKVIIVRLYPLLFMEKTQNGRYVVRNRRSEEKADSEYKRILEKKTEVIYDEIRSKVEKGLTEKNSKLVLPHEQEDELELANSQEVRKEISEMLEEKLKKCLVKRNVTQFLRLKIVDLKKPNFTKPALLTVWNPNEELIKCLSEGKGMSIMNVNFGNSLRNSNQIQINTTKQTQFKELVQHCDFPSRHLTSLESLHSNFTPYFNEVDMVGIVLVRNFNFSPDPVKSIFLVDIDCNFVRISQAGNYEDHCWKNALSHGSIIACSNLHWNESTRKQEIPVLFVTETTVFTENPKHLHLKEGIKKLKETLSKEVHSFVSLCEKELTKKLFNSIK